MNCRDCDSWLFSYESRGEKFGVCTHPIVEGKVLLNGDDDQEMVMHTCENFGCKYFMPNGGYVVTHLPEDLPGL